MEGITAVSERRWNRLIYKSIFLEKAKNGKGC
jgi:hypothetical protein